MKIKAVASVFAKNKRLRLINDADGGQWVTNEVAIYKLQGLPKMTPENILRMFDVPVDKHHTWICHETDADDNTIPLSCDYRGDVETTQYPLKVEWLEGKIFWNFVDGLGVLAIKEEYLKPLFGKIDEVTFWKRTNPNGWANLLVRDGLEVIAVIAPFKLHEDEDFVTTIAQVAYAYNHMWATAKNCAMSAKEMGGFEYTETYSTESE